MSNVIPFPSIAKPSRKQNLRALLVAVARYRHAPDSVFWLKENAEVLGMLVGTHARMSRDDLAPYAAFYDKIEDKLQFYPQYYRFFLSICLDLEDLGFGGSKGESLCRQVAAAGLIGVELSDLQRAEACHLLARRGMQDRLFSNTIKDRLRYFAERAETFVLPNKKAAYELAHIVFYLSDYGKRDPQLSEAMVTSLKYAGVLAYLDQNHDLLAEICTALHFAGMRPSQVWVKAVAMAHSLIYPENGVAKYPMEDAFHCFLVTGWAQTLSGGMSFAAQVPEDHIHFSARFQSSSVLRPMSECLMGLGPSRSSDWDAMRGCVLAALDPARRNILRQAEASTERFNAFFRGFARVPADRSTAAG
ncbi:hypothetical protein HKX54_05660 [Sulfitobacter sp. M57]|uniref:DUF6902 family protein n=1 Tax=unclassified Sulfitobacter TaxID=196795 RepID=UPI0023E24BEE|nr:MULTISPECIES: hypothetical protein [unclassified Sulfitobacter]MDF3413932.1 hypothetical protein [Sulfitobacter sp. KE5]MDF3420787.1 hypothetical protein [Sulfitobacter sp. KE43]MDF3432478.1 hypothetical protein [Sulfitobacter sp. KE42]MDF3458117.1 hypothetical protein [Sulfitobacter sp. S74]MDF3462018.1 hypothetical protein [Sulfitobacter sp. Ks18]